MSRVKKYIPVILIAASHLATAGALRAETAARYEAMLSGGKRITGQDITGWGRRPAAPRLDDTPLTDPKRPLLWLRDRSLTPWNMSADSGGFIEFVTGDRIAGRITGSRPGGGERSTPAHLLIMPVDRLEPTEQWAEPTPVRVLVGSIRRIVMKRIAGLRLQPGTLFYRTGRRVAFVSVHPGRDCLRLLLSNGTLNVKLAEIAEVHFPRIDPWDAYFRELRILSPTCRSRLVRLETTDGLIATASELRFHAEPYQSLEHHQRAEASIERLDRSVERLQKQVEQRQKRFEKAHSDYARQLEEIDKKLKSAGLAYENAKDELKRRSDRQAKTDADEMARRSQKIDREFKSADQAMINRLRPEKP